jgi:hypothetical protein
MDYSRGEMSMIRKLTAEDHENVLEYLLDEKAINLFIIGDLKNFGYDNDFQDVWAEFDENHRIKAVLLRYYDSFIPYAKGDFDVQAFADLIGERIQSGILSGKSEVTERFEELPDFSLGSKRSMFFAELKDGGKLDNVQDMIKIKKAKIEDVDRLIALHRQIDEFTETASSRDSFIRTIESGSGRTMFIEENGEIVASAGTTAENPYSAMVVGVCTKRNCREKGYASMCLSALCREILNEGKTLCLFYDNPVAGKIYKRLGFQDIGMWSMYRKEP